MSKVGRPKREQPFDKEIGNRICKARQEKGMTQKELADLLGVSRDTIRNWEHHRSIPYGIETYEKLSKVLDVEMMYIENKDHEIVFSKYPSIKEEILKSLTIDELLAEIKRRTEAS